MDCKFTASVATRQRGNGGCGRGMLLEFPLIGKGILVIVDVRETLWLQREIFMG